MDLPIQLVFFRKLELYQELQRLDQQQKENPASVWHLERRILAWSVSGHQHLRTAITQQMIAEHVIRELEHSKLIEIALGNLSERDFAKNFSLDSAAGAMVSLTATGRLMGEVIVDCDSSDWLRRNRYRLLYLCVWTLVLAGIVAALSAIFSSMANLFGFLHGLISNSHHWHHHNWYGS